MPLCASGYSAPMISILFLPCAVAATLKRYLNFPVHLLLFEGECWSERKGHQNEGSN